MNATLFQAHTTTTTIEGEYSRRQRQRETEKVRGNGIVCMYDRTVRDCVRTCIHIYV